MFEVSDVSPTANALFLHSGKMLSGRAEIGDMVLAEVEMERHTMIRRNHTAAHLLQAALRKVLGEHVEQAGQLVNEKEVRFDFTHFSALTEEELREVEQQVNQVILQGLPVVSREMPIEEAKKLGAMALFGEKYGDMVRVVSVGDFSAEFCGGTHIDNTSKIGLFTITSESSVAAGVRRITAVTANGVLEQLERYKALVVAAAAELKLNNIVDVPERAKQLTEELKERDRQISTLETRLAMSKVSELLASGVSVGKVRVIAKLVPQMDVNAARSLCDMIKDKFEDSVIVLGLVKQEKLTFVAACGKQALEAGCHAGNIVREVARLADGNGGGRPDSAMAGAKDLTKAEYAISKVAEIVGK